MFSPCVVAVIESSEQSTRPCCGIPFAVEGNFYHFLPSSSSMYHESRCFSEISAVGGHERTAPCMTCSDQRGATLLYLDLDCRFRVCPLLSFVIARVLSSPES